MAKGKPTLAARKTTRAQKAGYVGKTAAAAQASVTRQFGLVKNEAGKWVKPDAAFLGRQMAAQGYGPDQPVATPVAIGGARWMFGAGEPVFTGQRSDSAKRGPGAAYDATTGQVPYSAAGYGAPGRKKKGHGKALKEGSLLGKVSGGVATDVSAPGFAGPEAGAFVPYAEADVATTNYTRAQGKAYGRGRGAGLAGQTSSPPEAKATEESAVVGKRRARTGRGKAKGRGKAQGRRAAKKK